MKLKYLLSALIFSLSFIQIGFSQRKKNSIFTRAANTAPKFRDRRAFCATMSANSTRPTRRWKWSSTRLRRAAPDRVKIFDIGETNERRMQHLVAISSPQNIARLDEIKAEQCKTCRSALDLSSGSKSNRTE